MAEDAPEIESDGEIETPAEEQELEKLSPLARISALLFVSNKPVSAEALATAAKLKLARVENIIEEIRELFNDREHGFSLQEVAGGWQFRSAPAAAVAIKRLLPPKGKKLSRAAAETLAVIAYKQPVERSEIEAIRGVDALPTLKTLTEAKLIRIVGRHDGPGQPALYGTTPNFLEKFGLRDLSELPSLRELEELENDPGEGLPEESPVVEEAAVVEEPVLLQ